MQRLPAVALILALSSLVLAQTTPTPQPVSRDTRALALLSQCATTMGSAAILDTYGTGTLTPTNPSGPSATIVSRSKGTKMRNDITRASGVQTFALGATGGWSTQQGNRTTMPYAAFAYPRPEYVPALACIIDPSRPNMNVALVGVEQVGGKAAYHVKFNVSPSANDDSESAISEFHIFLDQQSFIVLKAQNYVFDPKALPNRSKWETYYSDYRTINGALMPFQIENYLAGQKVANITFNSVQINTGVPDSAFE